MKLFWEFSDFQVYGCCKNSQIFFKNMEQFDVWCALTDVI